jgi:hypothetical protein
MTELLEKAILLWRGFANAQLKTLSASEQDAIPSKMVAKGIAAMILEELEDEVLWDAAFAGSQDGLAKLGTEAMAEYHAGKTQELDPDTL